MEGVVSGLSLSRCLAVAVLLIAAVPGDAHAQYDGRVGALAGWRWTPNAKLAAKAESLGMTLPQSPGGPWIAAAFAYAPTPSFELGIELFGGAERLRLGGATTPLTSITYGGWLAARLRAVWGPALGAEEWLPWVGILGGPTLVNASGGPGNTSSEAFNVTYAPGLGLSARYGRVFVHLEARYLLNAFTLVTLQGASSTPQDVLDGGGLWVGLGFSWAVPSLSFAGDSSLRFLPRSPSGK